MSRVKRIVKELDECREDRQCGIALRLNSDNDLTHLTGSFLGPPGTPYEGGRFLVDISIPNQYPFKPPVMKFQTRIYHPNISSVTGAICLDILKDAWTPILTLKSLLISLQLLLETPEPNDPQDAEVAKVYLADRAAFDATAAHWTRMYATNPDASLATPSDAAQFGIDDAIVTQFENMGFPRDKTIRVLCHMGIKSFEGNGDQTELENKILEELLREE